MRSSFQLYRVSSLLVAMLVIYLASNQDIVKQLVPNQYASLVTVGFFVVLYKLLIYLYEQWLWRWIHSSLHFGGTWAYYLYNRTTNQAQIGIFQVRQRGFELSIPRGHVWPFNSSELNLADYGGRWSSDFIHIEEGIISFVYTMFSRLPRTGSPSPIRCQGFISLNASNQKELVGNFYDHDERVGHWGEIVAKRLSGFKRYSNRLSQARLAFPASNETLESQRRKESSNKALSADC